MLVLNSFKAVAVWSKGPAHVDIVVGLKSIQPVNVANDAKSISTPFCKIVSIK